eukprot:TRINITY_DN3028_c0_g1_i2.p1 TRINITY_DN3028_c0_g1~~TRINITY_DN3028_c0_g1_i2.p1  ORF type:complete len:878 (-),score=156.81 TRINITY_DN3028_c0_g1_i2:323-2884(-)
MTRAAKTAPEDATPLLADESARTPALRETRPLRRVILNFFYGEANPEFAKDAEHAVRGAFWVVLLGIPVMMPKGVWPARDRALELGIYNGGVPVFIIYNLGRTFGEAFANVGAGLRGKIFAFFMIWIFYTIFPRGYQPDESDYVFWGGVAIGTLYVIAVLILNFSESFQLFALSCFAFPWMGFLNSEDSTKVHPPWIKGWSLQGDAMTQDLLCTCIGFCLVLIVSLLPYPQWSLRIVQDKQLELNQEIPRVFRIMISYHCDSGEGGGHRFIRDQVFRNMQKLKDLNSNISPLLQASWWECYGLGRSQKKRLILSAMDATTDKLYDLLYNAWAASSVKAATSLDAEMLVELKPHTDRCLSCMEVCLNLLVRAAEDGHLSEAEALAVRKAAEAMVEEEAKLAAVYDDVREKVTKGEALAKYQDVRVAQVLLWTVSHILHQIHDLAINVEKYASLDDSALPPVNELAGFSGLFVGMLEKDHLEYACRGILSFLSCFWIGWFGYQDLLPARSAAIASTAAILLSHFIGSTMIKDMNRIQGLMLGNVMARLVVGLVLHCTWVDFTLHVAVAFIWMVASLFIYYHSETYATVGCLAAAFGASTMFSLSCDSSDLHKRTTFDSMTMTCMACLVTFLVDITLKTDRASDRAYISLDKCWDCLNLSIKEVLDPGSKQVSFHSTDAKGHLQTAKSMSNEADLEPRFWRTAWNKELFDQVYKETSHMIKNVSALEMAISSKSSAGTSKDDVMLEMPAKRDKTGNPLAARKLDAVKKLLRFFIHETEDRFPGLSDKEATYEFDEEEKLAEEEFVKNHVGANFGKRSTGLTSIRKDPLANIALVSSGLHRIKDILGRARHHILRSA